ncbi:MAG: phosphoribosylanthranilate isomerase [Megasphaera sp.]|jgi:phosphoribosylanthranilate isomerase|nr:phosphoribosylanthranilate isomerase [Megasphaera sp.]MCH4187368.1 phosphoribosylanthranilate isomerase [Megasphaera sp.]MCH4217550.1 phosphoribosylanthranilate isomerase [Megasphaera sp.]
MVKVKLCGLKRRCDIAWANEERPDFVGFVFAGKKRYVSDAQAGTLRSLLAADIPAVGVFVNDTIDHIVSLVRAGTIQLVQLHGQEEEAYISTLRSVIDVPLIKAFPVETAADMKKALVSSADYILVDHGAGGTGQTVDWSLLQGIERPWFLAGGLTPETVAEAVKMHPYALDVSSGIETDGVKDRIKMRQFMAQVRLAQQEELL